MSDNLGHPMPDGALNVPPSDVSTQGGQHVQVLVLEAASDLQSADTNPEGDPQALDPEITRTNDLEVADSVRANPQVPASVLQGSVAVGLQISAAFGGLRPYPNTTTLWKTYLRALPDELPRMNQLLAGFKMQFHPSATYSDYLARAIAGDQRGDPVTGAGMHSMALDGLRQLTDEEILSRLINLDLTVRLFRRNYVSTKVAREKEAAAAEVKAGELEAEKEAYQRLKNMYEGEFDRFEADRSRFYHEVDLFMDTKEKFQRDVMRIGAALNLGTTIEELEMNHDLLIGHLKAVLESNLIDSTAQLELLAKMGLSGGMEQWLQRSQDLLRQSADLTNSVSDNQARLVEQEDRHRAGMNKLEEENENLRLRLEYLTKELRETTD